MEQKPTIEKKKQWEDVYSKGREKLPWLENPTPTKILADFCSHFEKGDKVLDYGCGDGILAQILAKNGLKVACSDISEKALDLVSEKNPEIETIQAEEPSKIPKGETFDGVLVWGVMHHIDKNLWKKYVADLANITKENGFILFGGHSMKDEEFSKGFRISPTTGEISTAMDSLETILQEQNLKIIDSGYFDFKEGFTGKQRAFKYFLVQKTNSKK
jgi:cyclopropane fatty-acyl-phospholipid synthase-like methyltransferase